MKIGVLSDTRLPTKQFGSHGLGRVAYDIAAGLCQRNHDVTLYAGHGSETPDGVVLVTHDDEDTRPTQLTTSENGVWIDVSQHHELSRHYPDLPVLNYILGTECSWQPPNTAVVNDWQLPRYPDGRVILVGIDVDSIPLGLGGDYMAYAAKIHPAKGHDIAQEVARKTGLPLKIAGEVLVENWTPDPAEYVGLFTDDGELHRFIGGAFAFLAPSRIDIGGRGVLEAAACGTPVLCLDSAGTRAHVENGVSGIWCVDADDMAQAVQAAKQMDRSAVRNWAQDYHSIDSMLNGILKACEDILNGVRW